MLTWKQERNGWISNGYRIELLEPCRWVLLKAEPTRAPVMAEPIPLAETRTLTECKRQAELLDSALRVAQTRRRLWGQLVVALVAFVFVPTVATPWDLLGFLALLAVIARAIGFLAGTYMARSHLAVRDLYHQRGPIDGDRLSLWVTRYGARSQTNL